MDEFRIRQPPLLVRLDFTTNSPFARPTRSFAEERRKDRLQVRLSAGAIVSK